jgi:hypothetical protein
VNKKGHEIPYFSVSVTVPIYSPRMVELLSLSFQISKLSCEDISINSVNYLYKTKTTIARSNITKSNTLTMNREKDQKEAELLEVHCKSLFC